MTTKDEASRIARANGWLSQQPDDFQSELVARSSLRLFSKGETICHAGDGYDGVYGMVRGVVKIEFSTVGNTYRIAAVKQPVFWFGQAACFRKAAFYSTITATTPVAALFLPPHEFDRLIENAAYCKAFALLSLDHLEEATQAMGHLLVGDVEHRVAARLALLAERSGPQRPAVLQVTQFDLAEMCGLSRPTVQQILSNLEQRGLIKPGYRRIEVPNPEALVGGIEESPLKPVALQQAN